MSQESRKRKVNVISGKEVIHRESQQNVKSTKDALLDASLVHYQVLTSL